MTSGCNSVGMISQSETLTKVGHTGMLIGLRFGAAAFPGIVDVPPGELVIGISLVTGTVTPVWSIAV